MRGRIPLVALLAGCLMLAGTTSALASERNAIIAGAAVGALIGGSIAVQSYHGQVPLYIEIGAPPLHVYYYPAYPLYYQPRPYYRPYPLIVVPLYEFGPRHHKHHYRHYQRRHPAYYGPRW